MHKRTYEIEKFILTADRLDDEPLTKSVLYKEFDADGINLTESVMSKTNPLEREYTKKFSVDDVIRFHELMNTRTDAGMEGYQSMKLFQVYIDGSYDRVINWRLSDMNQLDDPDLLYRKIQHKITEGARQK